MSKSAKPIHFVMVQDKAKKCWYFKIFTGDIQIGTSEKFSRFERCKKFVDRIRETAKEARIEFE